MKCVPLPGILSGVATDIYSGILSSPLAKWGLLGLQQRMSKYMSEKAPDRMSGHVPQRMPDTMADRLVKENVRIYARVSDVCQIDCQIICREGDAWNNSENF